MPFSPKSKQLCIASGISVPLFLAVLWLLGIVALAFAGTAAALALATWNMCLREQLKMTAARLSQLQSSRGADVSRREEAMHIEEQLVSLRNRMRPEHPISRLPMREALLAHMTASRIGQLGALAFADHDRLTAIDPVLADRVLEISTTRLRQMLPSTRFAAQIDRAQVGLWFPDESEAEARAELEAIAYALSEEIEDDGYKVTPQIKTRLESADLIGDSDAGILVARAVASFSLPAGGLTAAPEPRTADDRAAIARDRYMLEQDLQYAVARNELRLAYQPLIDAEKRQVCGAEALIRWHHPQRGLVPPAHFIPIMETAGLSTELGMWALNSAVREVCNWRTEGHLDLRVAVNVSGLQLERNDLPLLIKRTLQHHGMTADALELELTESVATTDAGHCREIFKTLREMGIKLAVDDFGTGYSGFSSLRQLDFDKIKIDREFVTDVDSRRDSQAICQSIIALGRGLGIRVLAEGVERRAEYEWLRRHGCSHFQGFYFGTPMESGQFRTFVRDQNLLKNLLALDPAHTLAERLRA